MRFDPNERALTCGEIRSDLRDPLGIRQGVGAERFHVAFLFVVVDGAVEAEVAGLGGVDEAGGIVGTHLEEDAHLEFTLRLAVDGAVDVVERVDRGDDVDAVGGTFGDEVVEHRAGIGAGAGIVRGETKVFLVAEFLELLQSVNDDKRAGMGFAGITVHALIQVLAQGLKHIRKLAGAGTADFMWEGVDDLVEVFTFGSFRGGAVDEDQFQVVLGKLRAQRDEGEGHDGQSGFVALADGHQIVSALLFE